MLLGVLRDSSNPIHRKCVVLFTMAGVQVLGMTFSPSGRLLATWGPDCTVKVWKTAPLVESELERLPSAFFTCDAGIQCCCWAGGAAEDKEDPLLFLVVGDASGHVHFLDMPGDVLEAQ